MDKWSPQFTRPIDEIYLELHGPRRSEISQDEINDGINRIEEMCQILIGEYLKLPVEYFAARKLFPKHPLPGTGPFHIPSEYLESAIEKEGLHIEKGLSELSTVLSYFLGALKSDIGIDRRTVVLILPTRASITQLIHNPEVQFREILHPNSELIIEKVLDILIAVYEDPSIKFSLSNFKKQEILLLDELMFKYSIETLVNGRSLSSRWINTHRNLRLSLYPELPQLPARDDLYIAQL